MFVVLRTESGASGINAEGRLEKVLVRIIRQGLCPIRECSDCHCAVDSEGRGHLATCFNFGQHVHPQVV